MLTVGCGTWGPPGLSLRPLAAAQQAAGTAEALCLLLGSRPAARAGCELASPRSCSCLLTLLSTPYLGTFSFPCSLEHWCDWDRQGVVKALGGEPRMEAQLGAHGEEDSAEPCVMFLQSRFLFSAVCNLSLLCHLVHPLFSPYQERRFFVVQSLSRVWLCDPMDCSTPGFPVLHYLPEFAQVRVHWVGDAIPPSYLLLLLSLASLHSVPEPLPFRFACLSCTLIWAPSPWSASLLWDFFPFLSHVLCLVSGSLGGGLPHLGLVGYVTRLNCPRQICAPHATYRRPWVMQPFLEEEEGSGPRRPFDSVKRGSACFCCGPRPVPAPVVGTLETSRGGGKWKEATGAFSPALFSVSLPHFPREARKSRRKLRKEVGE